LARDCDGEVLADEGVSRRHLKLLPSPLGLSVVDLGSRNGTLVNGAALEGRVMLEHGDVVRLGRTEIVVLAPATARPAVHAPNQTVVFSRTFAFPAPPPLPPVIAAPSRAETAVRWLFMGAEPAPGASAFRNYLELPRRLPRGFWHAVRFVSILAYVALCVAMFVRPAGALFAFFKVIVPLLPILFFVVPGLWRNICPLAAANQTPRVLGFSKAFTPPEWLRRRGYIVAIVLFVTLQIYGIQVAQGVAEEKESRIVEILLATVRPGQLLAGKVVGIGLVGLLQLGDHRSGRADPHCQDARG